MVVYKVRRIILESYPVLLACVVIGLSAGHLLNIHLDKIRTLPLILMMIPPINDLGGGLGCILGARLASALHLGMIEPRFKGQKVLNQNLAASALMGSGVFLFVSALFFVIAYMQGMAPAYSARLMLAFFMAGLMLTVVVMLLTTVSAFVSFRKGLDPDNVVIPILTSVGDVFGVTCLLMAIKIIGV